MRAAGGVHAAIDGSSASRMGPRVNGEMNSLVREMLACVRVGAQTAKQPLTLGLDSSRQVTSVRVDAVLARSAARRRKQCR
jgi:hypothetical protein